MRSLIVGAQTLLGQYMCSYLREKGETYLGTEWMKSGYVSDSSESFADLSLLDPDAINRIITDFRPDHIFCFEAQSSVKKAWEDPSETININVNGTIHLLETIRKADVSPDIVLVGASEEYGRVAFNQQPIGETSYCRPQNIYAISKACNTMLAQIYHRAYDMRVCVGRIFNLIGPRQTDTFVVSNFCRQQVEIELGLRSAVNAGNLNVQRDFIDVRDAVAALWALTQSGRAGEIYNIGSGKAYRLGEVLQKIQKCSGIETEVSVERDRMRFFDTPIFEADISKIKADTGWAPKIPLEQSVAEILQFWRNAVRNADCTGKRKPF